MKGRPPVRRMVRAWYREARGGSPFRAEMEAQGKRGTWDYESETAHAPRVIRERLALEESGGELPDVMRTRYVFRADDQAVMLSTSYEPYALTRGEPVVFPEDGPYAGVGVVDRMAVIGVEITHCAEVVSARPALAEEARQLGLPAGGLVLTIERTYYADERPVETTDMVIPVDRYQLVYGVPVRGASGE
ncbi:UTRA domain-containing protein [Microtetraspora malaysiensis]|uniref:UTRA domain-containing protein n=1 Tax=Microtetraspora malaysiensis TaxID=161358 RepID=UPI003D92C680